MVPLAWMIMFLQTYFIRYVFTWFFVMQSEAEKTNNALTQILDNLPDAVLMMEAEGLTYCN